MSHDAKTSRGPEAIGLDLTSMESLLADIRYEVERQDALHPAGYPVTRDGIRLGLAAAEDEVREARDEWDLHKCRCQEPLCDHADWSTVRYEAMQAVAVLVRMVRSINEVTP